MSAKPILEQNPPAAQKPVVNDFSITVATVNGSGSQTSNLTILRALFKMGIPVSGKNLFPSNIQGLPTWYTIRISKDGFLARREEHEVVVAMNPATFVRDMNERNRVRPPTCAITLPTWFTSGWWHRCWGLRWIRFTRRSISISRASKNQLT
ncbi:MAG: 2-oxoacid:acceptor oxidoreductase family protein [Anaerolineales bacterium]|nr:2-oxoacid:acceptor oxidoreductase family protein [Anaerolineales bacterium]